MKPEQIIYHLNVAKVTQSKIAMDTGVTPQSVHKTIYGKIRSLKVAKAISGATGIPTKKLFPEWENLKAA